MWFLTPFIYLREQGEASWETCCSDIDLLAQSKSKHIHEKFCLHGSLTEAYLNSLSGTMLKHSDQIIQTQQTTSIFLEKGDRNSPYVAGSRNHAKTSAQPEKAQDLTASEAGYGARWQGSFARYSPDSSLWKTAQCSLLADSDEFSETWPRWGSVAIGASCQPVMSEHHIAGNGYGSEENEHGEQDESANQAFASIAVSAMRGRNDATTVLKWSIDGLGIVYEAEVLLENMPERGPNENGCAAWGASAPSQKTQKRMLRAVFLAGEFASSSQGQGHFQQLPGELTNTLRKLSQHVALGGQVGRWKITLNGASYLRPTPALPICKNASGLLPTPLANKHSGKNREDFSKSLHVVLGGPVNQKFAEWMMGWPINWTSLKSLCKIDFILWEILNGATNKTAGHKALPELWWGNDPAEMGQWEIRLDIQEQEILLNRMQQVVSTENARNESRCGTEAGPEDLRVEAMRKMRRCELPAASQGREPNQQFERKYNFLMSKMSCCGACEGGELGQEKDVGAKKMCDMWIVVRAPESAGQTVQGPVLLKRVGQEISRTAVGQKLRCDRLKAIGNGQVSRVVKTAWRILKS